MMTYIREKENPFLVTDTKETRLHHILTKEVLPDSIRRDLLQFRQKGHDAFLKERLIDKTVQISSTIHLMNLQTIARNPNVDTTSNTSKPSFKKHARQHNEYLISHIQKLFQFDLVSSSQLFDDNELPTKPCKVQLTSEPESSLHQDDYASPEKWTNMETVYIVDVMHVIRKLTNKQHRTFGQMCHAFMATEINANWSDVLFVCWWISQRRRAHSSL